MKLLSNLVIASLAFAIFSCSNDDDTTTDTSAPTIESVKLNNTEMIGATEEIEVHEDDSLSFTVMVADSEGLSQLRVSIHHAEDGHEHRSKKNEEELEEMAFIKEFDLSGTSATSFVKFADSLHYEGGEYHVEIAVINQAALRTEAVYEFHLEHEDHNDSEHDDQDHDGHEEDEHDEHEH